MPLIKLIFEQGNVIERSGCFAHAQQLGGRAVDQFNGLVPPQNNDAGPHALHNQLSQALQVLCLPGLGQCLLTAGADLPSQILEGEGRGEEQGAQGAGGEQGTVVDRQQPQPGDALAHHGDAGQSRQQNRQLRGQQHAASRHDHQLQVTQAAQGAATGIHHQRNGRHVQNQKHKTLLIGGQKLHPP